MEPHNTPLKKSCSWQLFVEKKKSKKAQVTIFLIGIVVLLLLVALYYALFHRQTIDPERVYGNQETLPIYEFTQNCMQSTAFKILSRMAAQGGYYDTAAIKVLPDPKASEGVKFSDTLVIPYWSYLDSNGLFASGMRPLEGKQSIEEELETLLPLLLNDCLNNYESFSNQYVVQPSRGKADVRFDDDKVTLVLEMPTSIIKIPDGDQVSISTYATVLPLDFKRMYTVAQKIKKAQDESKFLERHTINLLSLYSGIDAPLPPLAHKELGSSRFRYWLKPQVEQVIQKDILPMTQLVQVVNTLNFNPVVLPDFVSEEGKIRQGVYNSMSIQIADNTTFYPYAISFFAGGLPMSFSIGSSQVIMPKNMLPFRNFLFDAIGLKLYDYSFDYEFTYPVLVTLRKEQAWYNEPITLRFAFEANIKNNLPVTSAIAARPGLIAVTGLAFDDVSYFSDKMLTIHVVDALTQEPMNATLVYSCGAEATLGTGSKISTKIPVCLFPGMVVAKKEGYLSAVMPVNYDDKTKEVTLALWPIAQRKVKLELLSIQQLEGRELTPENLYRFSKPLPKDYQAFITIKRIKDNPEEEEIPLFGFVQVNANTSYLKQAMESTLESLKKEYPGLDISAYDLAFSNQYQNPENTIELVPGKYQIDIYVLLAKPLYIPEKKELICPCLSVLGACLCEKEEIRLPAQVFESFPYASVSHT
ncbi:MAG: hypothetical protein QW594_04280, partial [Candidatus Woesearchaeota archaeon]